MRRNSRINLIIAAIILLPFIGYGVMLMTTYIPMSESSMGNHFIFTVLLIVLGLAIPYWMLKMLFHAANIRNPHEKHMHLSDIPEDKDRLASKLDARCS